MVSQVPTNRTLDLRVTDGHLVSMSQDKRSLGSDNHSGIHPRMLEAITQANAGHAHSYGKDDWTQRADKLFRATFGDRTKNFYVFNGTAANVLAIDALVRSHQSVLCAQSSHLWQDECGAPQRLVGCQLIPIQTDNGKLTPRTIEDHLVRLGDQHASQPAAFSITQPTELGTLYTLDELTALGECAKRHGLKFHMDGARITNAAAALNCSLAQTTFEVGVDALSFGGTKHGLLHCEAVVLKNKDLAQAFKFRRKQAMQLPSKTRFMAAQFIAFLEENLWRDIANHANGMANLLRHESSRFPELTFPHPTQASAVFAKIPKAWLKPLREMRFFYVWDPETMLVRWSLGFDTTRDDIKAPCDTLASLSAAGVR